MARTELWSNPKFKRLVKRLALPAPYVVGLLETLWHAAYALRSAKIGDGEDVEVAADWPGKPGVLITALSEDRWVDKREDGLYYVHDLEDHAPDYVRKRLKRTQIKDLGEKTADNGRHAADNGGTQGRNGGIPNPTIPNHTQPYNTGGNESPPQAMQNSPLAIKQILDAYPLRQGLRAAEWQVGRVIVAIRERGNDDPVGWLLKVVKDYAESDVVKAGKIWSARRFFEDGHYDDDPATWANSKKQETKTDDNEDCYRLPTPEQWEEIRRLEAGDSSVV